MRNHMKMMIAGVIFIVVLLIGISSLASGGDTCHIDRLILKKALIQSYEYLTEKEPNINKTLDVIEHAAYSTGTELP